MNEVSLETITPADDLVMPLDLATAKAHLRVDHAYDDAAITALIVEGVHEIERKTGRMLRPASYRYRLSDFRTNGIPLPRPPYRTITEIYYYDTTGTEVELVASKYDLHGTMPAMIAPSAAANNCGPVVRDQLAAVRIDFDGGYDAADIPETLVRALKIWLDVEYNDHADGTVARMLRRWRQIVDGYVVHHPGLAGVSQ